MFYITCNTETHSLGSPISVFYCQLKQNKEKKKKREKPNILLGSWSGKKMCMHQRNLILKLRRFLSLSNMLKEPNIQCTFPIIQLKGYKRTRTPINRIRATHTLFSSYQPKLHNSETCPKAGVGKYFL